jgi:hypothetical protein
MGGAQATAQEGRTEMRAKFWFETVKGPPGRSRHGEGDNIKTDLEEIGCVWTAFKLLKSGEGRPTFVNATFGLHIKRSRF